MGAIRLEAFGGAIPIRSARLLPDQFATDCANIDLLSGELRGLRLLTLVEEVSGDTAYAKVIKYVNRAGVGGTFLLRSRFGAFHPYQLVNDRYGRVITHDYDGTTLVGPRTPVPLRVTTFCSCQNGYSVLLGVPTPASAMTVTPPNVGTLKKTVSYTYTFVDEFGQEGPPALPTVASGDVTGTWELTDISNPVDGAAILEGYPFAKDGTSFASLTGQSPTKPKVRIYRTVTSAAGIATYYRVAELDMTRTGTLEFSDDLTDQQVASSSLLQSASWAIPPVMCGILPMPNGFYVGWNGRNIYFSEPYRPWAWPPEYQLSVDYAIIGCGVFGQSVVAVTESNPYIITGTRPSSMTMAKIPSVEPGVSAPSIVSSPEGVYFATKRGLLRVGQAGIENVTRDLIDEDDWYRQYGPNITCAARFGTRYIAMAASGGGSATAGFMLDWRDARVAFTRLQTPVPVEDLWTDAWTGEVHISTTYNLADSNQYGTALYTLNAPAAGTAIYTWHSKEFFFQKPVNMAAVAIAFDQYTAGETGSWGPLTDPLDAGSVPDVTTPSSAPQDGLSAVANTEPINTFAINGWGPAYRLVLDYHQTLQLPADMLAYMTVYANRVPVWSGEVRAGEMIRLPSGFKTAVWSLRVTSRAPIFAIQVATTAKELARV